MGAGGPRGTPTLPFPAFPLPPGSCPTFAGQDLWRGARHVGHKEVGGVSEPAVPVAASFSPIPQDGALACLWVMLTLLKGLQGRDPSLQPTSVLQSLQEDRVQGAGREGRREGEAAGGVQVQGGKKAVPAGRHCLGGPAWPALLSGLPHQGDPNLQQERPAPPSVTVASLCELGASQSLCADGETESQADHWPGPPCPCQTRGSLRLLPVSLVLARPGATACGGGPCRSPAPANPVVPEGWMASATDRVSEDTDTGQSRAWPLMTSNSLIICSVIT